MLLSASRIRLTRTRTQTVILSFGLILAAAGVATAQSQLPLQTPSQASLPALIAGRAILTFPLVGTAAYGIRIHQFAGGPDALAAQPVQMLVCTACTVQAQMVEQPFTGLSYTSVTPTAGGILAAAVFVSTNGSRFQIDDLYSLPSGSDASSFIVKRTVTVLTAVAADHGFNSQFLLGFEKPVSLEQYHFFAPAIWYDHNANDAQSGGFGTNPLNSYFFWRETRSPLPLMMEQDPASGSTLSIAHINSTPAPGMDNLNNAWIVDPTVQYGSIGVQKVPAVALGFIYPGSEGDGSYLGVKSYLADGPSTNWVRRSHPVSKTVSHTYTLMINLDRDTRPGGGADFKHAMARTWRQYYNVFNPPIAGVPSDTVVTAGVNLINGYVEDVNGATGLPFGRPLTSGITPQYNPIYEMGYVGMQIPLGFQLFRQGILHNDPVSLAHGKAILDWWANHAGQPSGLPLPLYNAASGQFQSLAVGDTCAYPLFTRLVSDGMEGMVVAAIFARQHNQPQLAWESFAQGYGDWLVDHQNKHGSFYRAYNPNGSVYTGTCLKQDPYSSSEFNTPDVIRFLVELYFATGSQKYLTTAQLAGQYSLKQIYEPVQYIGGTIDNPNVIDKEGGVEAMHGALALLDAAIAQGDREAQKTWLAAAQDAADYTRTWAYAWNFPITLPQGAVSSGAYPAYQFSGTRAIGLIATGQSTGDISLSYESYDYLRLALFQQEKSEWERRDRGQFDLTSANLFWNNTKLTTQLTSVPGQNFGYLKDGLLGEGVDLSDMIYSDSVDTSAHTWLPWLTNAELDPIQRLQDTFRVDTLSDIQGISPETLKKENDHLYPIPGSIGWGRP